MLKSDYEQDRNQAEVRFYPLLFRHPLGRFRDYEISEKHRSGRGGRVALRLPNRTPALFGTT